MARVLSDMIPELWSAKILEEAVAYRKFMAIMDPVGAKADELEDLYGPPRWFHRLPYRLRKPFRLWSPRERALQDAACLVADPWNVVALGQTIQIPKLGDLNVKT